jgi:serine/threonine protein kinase
MNETVWKSYRKTTGFNYEKKLYNMVKQQHPDIVLPNVVFKNQSMIMPFAKEISAEELNNFDDAKLVDIFYKLALTLQKLHSAGITHADIKPSNIVLYEDSVKLIDFEFAFTESTSNANGGTEGYKAIEILKEDYANADSTIDIWTYGIMLAQQVCSIYNYNILITNVMVDLRSG